MSKLIFCAVALIAFYVMITHVGDKQAAMALTASAGFFLLLTLLLFKDLPKV